MALHPNFPLSPYETLSPDLRWFPVAEELRSTAYEKLLPPLVAKVREEVKGPGAMRITRAHRPRHALCWPGGSRPIT